MKKLYKSNIDRKVAGVCGGLSDYFEIDSTVFRLLWVAAIFFSLGTAVFMYFVFALIMPNNPGEM